MKAVVPPERLLVFTVGQGWEPLCTFLGVPVPDTPFPNVNDRPQVKKIIADITRGAYGIVAGAAVAGVAALYGIGWALGVF